MIAAGAAHALLGNLLFKTTKLSMVVQATYALLEGLVFNKTRGK
jgi:hypothetical protein